jgi:hypothetical protein
MRAAATPSPGSEFQDFLYAPICQEQEGMTLSVLSALARRDVDPWMEAERLSQLPKETATAQITDLLEGLPRLTLARLDRVEVAARLSALLPPKSALAVTRMLESIETPKQNPRVFAFNWRYFYFYVCLMLLINLIMAEFRAPPVPPGASGTPVEAVRKAPEAAIK